MRLIKVTAPSGGGQRVADLALRCGISEVSVHQVMQHKTGTPPTVQDVVDARLSTSEASIFLDALLGAPFFDRDTYSLEIRQARSILKRTSIHTLTDPVPAPILDVEEELWQFTHVTYSLMARVLIAALLLAYGMIEDNLLFIIGGLIFLPFMPIMLALAFGVLTRQWQLLAHGIFAFGVVTVLIAVGAFALATVADPPMLFDRFAPPAVGLAFSLAIGIAGALGTADDTGHRQLVGLAAASQLALLPAWFGMSLVFGFSDDVGEKMASFAGNIAAVVVGAVATYAVLSFRSQFSYGVARSKEYEL